MRHPITSLFLFDGKKRRRHHALDGKINLALATVVTLFGLAGAPSARAQQKKLNILVIFGDDVDFWNVSAYNRGMTAAVANANN
jgi:hypothetical protein